jgi:hypothetical protein
MFVGNLAFKLPDSCIQSPAIITSMIAEKIVLDSSGTHYFSASRGEAKRGQSPSDNRVAMALGAL